MAKQTFTTGQVLTAAQMTSLQQTAMGGGDATAKTTSYVLVAADAGTTVAMNAAGSTTITVNTGLFSAGDTVFIQNRGAGVCTVTAGTATVNTHGSLALAQYEGGQLYFTATGAAIFFDISQSTGMTNPMTTTGDTIYSSSGSTPARLGIGSTGNVLTVAGGVPTWAAPAGGSLSTAVFADEKTSGTQGGTATSGAYRTRDLNTSRGNSISGCSLASNQITLPAGTFYISASAPANNGVNGHQTRLQNITDSTTAIFGHNTKNPDYVSTSSTIQGVITIASSKVFELQHRVTTTYSADGFGTALSFNTEVYSQITIMKVG